MEGVGLTQVTFLLFMCMASGDFASSPSEYGRPEVLFRRPWAWPPLEWVASAYIPLACNATTVHSAASLRQAMACIVNAEHKRYKSVVNRPLNNRR